MGAQRHGGAYSTQSASVVDKSFLLPLHDCVEIFFYRYSSAITEPAGRTPLLPDRELSAWITQQMRIDQFAVVNSFPFSVLFFWCSESNEPALQNTLAQGERIMIGTFVGHVFAARQLVDETTPWSPTNPLVDFFAVKELEYELSPHNVLDTCANYLPHAEVALAAELPACGDLEGRYHEFTNQLFYETRLAGNFFQPKVVRPITATGFEKRRLPAGTHEWLRAWYENEQLRQQMIETSAGPCMNQHVAPSEITHLPPELKDKLSDDLRPTLEGWYGGPLILTSIYGIRKYNNGSVLRMHVDTVRTHAVSAIINVDQAVRKDWPLLILDHDGNECSVHMEPGDMVLYESARLLHGRPDMFDGDHYDNIFIHYRPAREEEWDYNWI